MLIDSPQVVENSSIKNATVASGTAFPGTPNIGELFYITGSGTPPVGLYVYTGAAWEIVTVGGQTQDPALSAHLTDYSMHQTTAQNDFLDGITVAFGEVNKLSGLASFLGTPTLAGHLGSLGSSINTINNNINTINNNIATINTTKVSVDGSTPMTGNLNLGGFTIVNTSTAPPTAPTDLVTKAYVDSIVSDQWVRAMVARVLL